MCQDGGCCQDGLNQELRRWFELSPEPQAILDASARFLRVNPAFCEMLGFDSAEVCDLGALTRVVHPDATDALWQTMRPLYQGQARTECELTALTRCGREIIVLWSFTLDEVTGNTYLVARDVTQIRAAEERQRVLEQQVAQAQKLESIGQLAAGIAHDINTPTQFSRDNVQFLGDVAEDLQTLFAFLDRVAGQAPEQQDFGGFQAELREVLEEVDAQFLREEAPVAVSQAMEGLERIAGIVSAMKEFSHPGDTNKSYADLNRGIRNTVTVSSNEWKYVARLHMELADMPQLPLIVGELNQVVLNLIVNACHAIEDRLGKGSVEKGDIWIRSFRQGSEACVEVQDTGVGIPESVRQRIFDPFFTTKEVGRGTGQGLAMAHGVIVERHSGRIEVDSVPGEGTTFRLYLPMECDEEADEAAA